MFAGLPVLATPVTPLVGGGLPTGSGPTDLQSYQFWIQFFKAIQEKQQPFGCGTRFPPPNIVWGGGTIDSVTDNMDVGPHTLTIHFSGVDWTMPPGTSGKRWVGLHYADPDLCGIPGNYDLVVEGDVADPYTVIRATIIDDTYTPASHTGTIKVSADYIFNAVVAGFIGPDAITWLVGKTANFMKSSTGLWSTDREPTKPNQRELWKGTIDSGFWDDSNSRGTLQQITDIYNRNPYNIPANPPVQWTVDKFKNKEALFFDEHGKLYRQTIIGNDLNRLVFGAAEFKLTTGGASGGFQLVITVQGLSTPTATIPYNGNAAAIQSAINAVLTGGVTVTVTGGGPFAIVFSTSAGAANLVIQNNTTGFLVAIDVPTGSLSLSGTYTIVGVGDKGMPGRNIDPMFVWYRGAMVQYYSHDPFDNLTGANKPQQIVNWSDRDSDNNCNPFPHLCFHVDCQIEYFNNCECVRAGDFISPKFYCSWGELQRAAVGLLSSYVDIFNPFGDGSVLRMFTPATWALGYQTDGVLNTNSANLHAWSTTLAVDPITHIGTVSSTGAMPYYPISVYYTVQDSHDGILTSGQTQMSALGVLSQTFDPAWDGFTIILWPGFSRFYRRRFRYLYPKTGMIPDCTDLLGCIDPPAITGDGHLNSPTGVMLVSTPIGGTLTYNTTYSYRISAANGSGETLATTAVTIKAASCTSTCPTAPCPPNATTTVCQTANTYTITVGWNPVVGASSYNIYGNVGGSEGLIGTVSAPTTSFTDDGSFTPGASVPVANTTFNDCFGAGIWIRRGVSDHYQGRADDSFVIEGGIPPCPVFQVDEIAAYTGDNFPDTFDGRGGVRTELSLDAEYWDNFYRGTRIQTYELNRSFSRQGTITHAGRFWIQDKTKTWWTDPVNNGNVRYQGGIATGGSSTSLTDSTYNTGQKACWWNSGRFLGLGGQWGQFILQICAGGLPVGWATAADGTATYTEPDQSHSGTLIPGSAPTITSVRPSIPVADSREHIFVVVGNNFAVGCVLTITDPSSGITTNVPTISIAPGVVVINAFAFTVGGSWHVMATNPGNLDSNNFAFTVQTCYRVPIVGGAAGVLTYTAVTGITATTGDGYLIAEPVGYELNKWQSRYLQTTKLDGTKLNLRLTNSGNDDLYFVEQATSLEVGQTYTIQEYTPSSKFKFKTTVPIDGRGFVQVGTNAYWVDPAGDADTRSGTNVPFLKDIKKNLETKVVDYGYYMSMDDIGPHIFNELYYMIRSLRWTKTNYTYVSDGNPDTRSGSGSAYNDPAGGLTVIELYGAAISSNGGCFLAADGLSHFESVGFFWDMPATASGCFALISASNPGTTGTPSAFSSTSIGLSADITGSKFCGSSGTLQSEITVTKAQAFGQVTKPTCISATVEFYSWGSVGFDETLPETSVDGPFLTGGSCYESQGCIHPNEYTFTNFTGDSQVVFHKYTLWNSVGSNTNAVVQSGVALGDISTPPPMPSLPTIHSCDILSGNSGWTNSRLDALIKWDGMLYI